MVAQIVNIMMDYKQMVETAVKNGGGEKVMWSSVDVANEIMHYATLNRNVRIRRSRSQHRWA